VEKRRAKGQGAEGNRKSEVKSAAQKKVVNKLEERKTL